MDEADVILAARRFVRSVESLSVPVPLDAYARKAEAKLCYADLPSGQSGYSGKIGGKWTIVINSNERLERQRFTVCHEIAHIHLSLPTNHEGQSDSGLYTKRPQNEVFCDIFAAEVLLPSDLFRPRVDEAEIGFSSVDRLADEFGASLTATGSRFAFLNRAFCAFVLAERGFVRYASRSPSLKEIKAWIPNGYKVPPSSLAARGRDLLSTEQHTVDPTEWFEDWDRSGTLFEEARYLSQWDQTLSLLWFEEDHLLTRGENEEVLDEDADPYCKELDGSLPWPKK
jgi:hypothetical protein